MLRVVNDVDLPSLVEMGERGGKVALQALLFGGRVERVKLLPHGEIETGLAEALQ